MADFDKRGGVSFSQVTEKWTRSSLILRGSLLRASWEFNYTVHKGFVDFVAFKCNLNQFVRGVAGKLGATVV